MNREYHCWYSERLQRDMELLVFGHSGAKVLVFPTRCGRFYEYEDLGIIRSLQEKIDAGQMQLFCVDSIDDDSVYCDWRHPADRILRHIDYEEYILNEVLPLMATKNTHPCTISHGCSLGAYHAANIAFRHPHLFSKLCAFSGRYDLCFQVESFEDLFNGYYDDNIYFHSPSHFVHGLDASQLDALRGMDVVFVIGNEDPFLDHNLRFSEVMSEKGIGHELYRWDGRAHRGRYWRRMAPLYL